MAINKKTAEPDPASSILAGAPLTATPEAPSTAAPSLSTLESRMDRTAALSPEGHTFVARFREEVAKNVKTTGEFIVDTVPNPIETLAVIDTTTNLAVLLIFNESFMATTKQFAPVGDNILDIMTSFRNKFADKYQMAAYQVVTPEEYDRVVNWATACKNILRALRSENEMKADTFKGLNINVSVDLNLAKSFIDKVSPHKVKERADWGVVVSRAQQVQTLTQGPRTQTLSPIMAITGYTKIMRVHGGYSPFGNAFRYVPIVVITNITSVVPSQDMIELALPMVAGTIISQGAWKRPYCTFKEKAPNLGRLKTTVRDGQQVLDWFEREDRIIEVIQDVPLLAIDLAEGRTCVPGISKYIDKDSLPYLQNKLNRFFGEGVCRLAMSPVVTAFTNYEGTFLSNGVEADTRSADYLNLIESVGDTVRCEGLLEQAVNTPERHLQEVSAIFGEDSIKSLYRVTTIVLDGNYVNELSKLVNGVVTYQLSSTDSQNIDWGSILNSNRFGVIGNQFFGAANPLGGAAAMPVGYYGAFGVPTF